MNLKNIIEDKRNLAQIYLSITSLLVAFGQDKSFTIPITHFLDVIFFDFIVLFVVYYVFCPSCKGSDKWILSEVWILSIEISVLFTTIVYYFLVGPIVNTNSQGLYFNPESIPLFFILILFTFFNILALGIICPDKLENKIILVLLLVAVVQSAWIIGGTYYSNLLIFGFYVLISLASVTCIYFGIIIVQKWRELPKDNDENPPKNNDEEPSNDSDEHKIKEEVKEKLNNLKEEYETIPQAMKDAQDLHKIYANSIKEGKCPRCPNKLTPVFTKEGNKTNEVGQYCTVCGFIMSYKESQKNSLANNPSIDPKLINK